MSDIAIRVEGLGKQYRIGGLQEGYKTFRESLMDAVQAPVRRLGALLGVGGNGRPAEVETFWALKDVSFEVKQGEVVGIIGRNGAGKSTLLKILSRITEPTRGRVEILGRVGSLLEVGTGFHPELTGRENIFLNGAILGMRKAEIVRRFDEIVAFAEVEKFIDTPVKRYSSGMYLRLAFAVAAHLDPEILLVDEVLAVGDAAFQKKCLGKMDNVAREGRSVLFVSHNLASLGAICEASLLLEGGALVYRGSMREGINQYLSRMRRRNIEVFFDPEPGCDIRFTYVAVVDEAGNPCEVYLLASEIRIVMEYEVLRPIEKAAVACHIWNLEGVHVLSTADIDFSPDLLEHRDPGIYRSEILINPYLLAPGTYQIELFSGIPNLKIFDSKKGPVFEVSAVGSYAANWSGGRQGVIIGVPFEWHISQLREARANALSLSCE